MGTTSFILSGPTEHRNTKLGVIKEIFEHVCVPGFGVKKKKREVGLTTVCIRLPAVIEISDALSPKL
jgi:hypothetical protein